MKKLFTLAFLCVSLSAFSQPKYYGNFYGNITNATGAASMQTVVSSTNWIGSDGKMSTFGGVMNFSQGASSAFRFGSALGAIDGHILAADYTGDGSAVTNVNATNITINASVLAPASQQTNYTIVLIPGVDTTPLQIYLANTNVFITFTGTNQSNWSRSAVFRGWTNSVTSTIRFISGVRTNENFVNQVSAGWSRVLNFYNLDTTGTNVLITDGGRYQ